MTPTLLGRIQTRLLLIATVGVVWTAIIAPALPRPSGVASFVDLYPTLFEALVWFALIGAFVWEPIYHGLQQFRWEKDWPLGFGLLTFFNEAFVVWLLVGQPQVSTFAIHAATTWIVMWAVAAGPLKIVLLRWRFRGGRFTEWTAW